MGKIMYKGQEYGGGGGSLPETYDGLSHMLEEEILYFDTGYNITTDGAYTDLHDSVVNLYESDIYNGDTDWGAWEDEESGYSSPGTETSSLKDAMINVCDRIIALEQGGGGTLPAEYAGLTRELGEDGHIGFGVEISNLEYAALAFTGYHPTVHFDTSSHIISADGWGDTDEDDLFRAIYDMCERIASLEESGIPDSYAGLTAMLEDEDVVFDSTSDKIQLKNYTVIDLDYNGDIVKAGYWGDNEISDSSSLINYLSALSSYATGTQLDVNNLTDTVDGLSGTVDTLRDDFDTLSGNFNTLSENFDTLSEDLAGFTTGYFTFADPYSLESSGVSLYLYNDADIIDNSGYWGAWEDEQTQESSDGTSETSLKNAIVYICKKLDELEARIAALES